MIPAPRLRQQLHERHDGGDDNAGLHPHGAVEVGTKVGDLGLEVGLGGDAFGDGVADGFGMRLGLGFVDSGRLEPARVG